MTIRPLQLRSRPACGAFARSVFAALILFAAAQAVPLRVASAETANDALDTCRLAGGGGTVESAGISCCWPGWGCLHCATDAQGNMIEGGCYMRCSSAECAQANDTLTPGNPKLPRSVKDPDAFLGQMAPPKNPKTKKPLIIDQGTTTVQ